MEGPGEQTEHPDTPMRKRPRLEGVVEDEFNTAEPQTPPHESDDTVTHITSDDSTPTSANGTTSPLQTPSKVTLNLRSTDSSPMLPQRPMQTVSNNAVKHESASTSRGSTPPEFVIVGQDQGSDSGEVVDIEVDDPEDIFPSSHDGLDGTSQEVDMLEIYRDAMASFPSLEKGKLSSSLDRVGWWQDLVVKESVDLDVVMCVSDWIHETWLEGLPDMQPIAYMTYVQDKQFWDKLIDIYKKLLSNKGMSRIRSSKGSDPIQLLSEFFLPQMQLCSAMISADLGNLSSPKDASIGAPEMVSSKYLLTLSLLLRRWDSSPFWHFLKTKHSLDVDDAQFILVTKFMANTPTLVKDLSQLCRVLLSSPGLSSKFGNEVVHCVNIMSHVLRCATHRLAQDDKASSTNSHATIIDDVCDCARDIFIKVKESPSKNLPQLSPDQYSRMFLSVADLVYLTVHIDSTRVNLLLDDNCTLDTSVEEAADQLVSDCMFLEMYWALAVKARMELRVQSVDRISARLVNHWVATEKLADGARAGVRHFVADWMTSVKIVEYLTSVESHPQLMMRSGDILGFLLVTKTWTNDMSDAVWTSLYDSPDPRMCAATWEAFTRGTRHMTPSLLSDTSRRLCQMSPKAYQPETVPFLEQFVVAMRKSILEGDYTLNDGLENPLNPFRKILCDTVGGVPEGADAVLMSTMHSNASRWLSIISGAAKSEVLRTGIYEACIQDLQARSNQSLGSVISVLALLNAHNTEATATLMVGMQMFQVVAEELCFFIDEAKKHKVNDETPQGLDQRLQLLYRLAIWPTTASKELQDSLVRHMVGADALNNASRDQAWMSLKVLAGNAYDVPFIQDFILKSIMTIAPEHFTSQMLQFIQMAIERERSTGRFAAVPENAIVEIPFIDCVWRLALGAPERTVEVDAINSLSYLYVSSSLMKSAPLSSVVATHVSVIDRCLAYLQESAAKLKQSSLPISTSQFSQVVSEAASTQLASDDEEHVIRFTRTLGIMRQIIDKAKSATWLKQPGSNNSSPTMSSMNEAGVDVVELKFQAFGTGQSTKLRSLTIATDATFADLLDCLRERTGLREMTLIVGGTKLKLGGRMGDPITSIIDKGAIMVQNNDHGNMAPAPTSKHVSAAEQAVSASLDQLYELLELDGRPGRGIYDFLLSYPPHDRVREMMMQHDDANHSFPMQHRMQAIYYIWSLRTILQQHTKSNSMDEVFLVKTIRLLTRLLTNDQAVTTLRLTEDAEMTYALIACLQLYLRERPVTEKISDHIENGASLASKLYDFAEQCLSGTHGRYGYEEVNYMTVYGCLLELALLDDTKEVWTTLVNLPRLGPFHERLLVAPHWREEREPFSNVIVNSCDQVSGSTSITPQDMAKFFWHILSPLISTARNQPFQCKELFDTLSAIFSTFSTALLGEDQLRGMLTGWTTLLSEYRHHEAPGSLRRDEFVKGLISLLDLCVSSLKSYKKPIGAYDLLQLLVNRYLFPTVAEEETMNDEKSTTSPSSPILDPETSKQALALVASLYDTKESYHWLVQRLASLSDLEGQTSRSPFSVDRSRWLRSSAGFSGLSNLTNTCYMNSLVAQLFMNTGFRAFMLRVDAEDKQEYNLLKETQNLFAHMQGSHDKFATTRNFAHAIRPYEDQHIDVTVQMDVDEFYNLLFDRWEMDLKTKEAKQQFRSFYGGQFVGQIKSRDCEHVSETIEPFFTIACEVRGRKGLEESLKAYVQGDVMEGDNKYKCESCDGRFVNAVKRQCLKDLPDNLIFNLKRFDFDLTTLQRSKINDKFNFPNAIDMTPFTVEYINNPTADAKPDWFKLVGVLVHMGTAETGHYYSFIRIPPHANATSETWAEFNDQEVTEMDPNKLEEYCYGGETDINGTVWPKIYSAYMLFYRRASALEVDDAVSRRRNTVGPIDALLPTGVANSIQQTNQQLLRRYSLVDPFYGHLIRRILSDMKVKTGGSCSDSHDIEKEVLGLVLNHATIIFSRVGLQVPDLRPTLEAILKQVSGCPHCCEIAIDWIAENPGRSEELLVLSQIATVRQAWAEFVPILLKHHRVLDPEIYGLPSDEDLATGPSAFPFGLSTNSSLLKIVTAYRDLLPGLGKSLRAWDDYFNLWYSIATMGIFEVSVLLWEGVLIDVLEITRMEKGRFPKQEKYRQFSNDFFASKRIPSGFGLIRLLAEFFKFVDPCLERYTNRRARIKGWDQSTQRFPLMSEEYHLITEVSLPNNNIRLLICAIDLWQDIDSQPFYPAELVSELLLCIKGPASTDGPPESTDHDLKLQRQISSTLNTAAKDYELYWSKTHLLMSLAFCRECTDIDFARPIMFTVAKSALSALLQLGLPNTNNYGYFEDYREVGGVDVLNFFAALSKERNSSRMAATGLDEPHFLPSVLEFAPVWASGLLVFECRMVREPTEKLLMELIFDRYPTDQASDSDVEAGSQPIITSLDKRRIVTVRQLWARCRHAQNEATRIQLPEFFQQSLGSVMAQCASWCHKLSQEETGPLASLRKREDEDIVSEFSHMEHQHRHWRLEDETADEIEETEWGDSGNDSDMLTETG